MNQFKLIKKIVVLLVLLTSQTGNTQNIQSCAITIPECPSHPERKGSFYDSFQGSSQNLERCHARAKEFQIWCGSSKSTNIVASAQFADGRIEGLSTLYGRFSKASPASPANQNHSTSIVNIDRESKSDWLFNKNDAEKQAKERAKAEVYRSCKQRVDDLKYSDLSCQTNSTGFGFIFQCRVRAKANCVPK